MFFEKLFFYIWKLQNNYYQRHKEKLQKEACERYQNLSDKEKNKRQNTAWDRYQKKKKKKRNRKKASVSFECNLRNKS